MATTVNREIGSDGGEAIVRYSFNSTDCSDAVVDKKILQGGDWFIVSVEDNSIKIYAPPNQAAEEKICRISPIVNGIECNDKLIIVTQEGRAEYVFTYGDGSLEKILILHTPDTYVETYSVISKEGESNVEFEVYDKPDWINVTVNSTTSFTIDVSENTGGDRVDTVVLKQKYSDKLLTLEVRQEAAPLDSVFVYEDGSTAKTITTTNKYKKTFTYYVTSTVNGELTEYYPVQDTVCNWVTFDVSTGNFKVRLQENETGWERTCDVMLKQERSDAIIVLRIIQSAYDCEEFIDSCCGKSSYKHPDYDIAVGYGQDSTNYDSVDARVTSLYVSNIDDVPDWLHIEIMDYPDPSQPPHKMIKYTVDENDGDYRSFIVEYEAESFVESAENICEMATVLVRQDANPNRLITINLRIVNSYSSDLDVASVKFNFVNGTVTHKKIDETIEVHDTYDTTDKFSDTLNNNNLDDYNPFVIICNDGTFMTGTINNKTITNGEDYIITITDKAPVCDCADVIGNLPLPAVPTEHKNIIGTFNSEITCQSDDFRLVKINGDDIVIIESISIEKVLETEYAIYANYNENQDTTKRSEEFGVQKVSDGTTCGRLTVRQNGKTEKWENIII